MVWGSEICSSFGGSGSGSGGNSTFGVGSASGGDVSGWSIENSNEPGAAMIRGNGACDVRTRKAAVHDNTKAKK
jgi:hypothetical protein